MRFLIFNFVAVLAVGYLVFGQDIKPGALIDRVTGTAETSMKEVEPEVTGSKAENLQQVLKDRVQELEGKLKKATALPDRIDSLERENAGLKTEIAVLKDRLAESAKAVQTPAENPLRHMAGSTEAPIEENALDQPSPSQQEIAALSEPEPQKPAVEPIMAEENAAEDQPKFLTPKERRRELQLLSLDLEELYIRSQQ